VTNAHVIATGDHVELASWDGHDLDAAVNYVARRHDLAVLVTRPRVPVEPLELADADAQRGQPVIVVGFPRGGRITVEDDAHVVDVVDASRYGQTGSTQ
jgi:S1-C subfamily serine protease